MAAPEIKITGKGKNRSTTARRGRRSSAQTSRRRMKVLPINDAGKQLCFPFFYDNIILYNCRPGKIPISYFNIRPSFRSRSANFFKSPYHSIQRQSRISNFAH
jgi:hypothetical protein